MSSERIDKVADAIISLGYEGIVRFDTTEREETRGPTHPSSRVKTGREGRGGVHKKQRFSRLREHKKSRREPLIRSEKADGEE